MSTNEERTVKSHIGITEVVHCKCGGVILPVSQKQWWDESKDPPVFNMAVIWKCTSCGKETKS